MQAKVEYLEEKLQKINLQADLRFQQREYQTTEEEIEQLVEIHCVESNRMEQQPERCDDYTQPPKALENQCWRRNQPAAAYWEVRKAAKEAQDLWPEEVVKSTGLTDPSHLSDRTRERYTQLLMRALTFNHPKQGHGDPMHP